MFLQCEDDPNFILWGEATCSMVMEYVGSCEADWGAVDDNTGVAASEACPASCGTGCALTFDSCWNSPCQNGAVCVNLPGVRSLACDWANCAQGYWGAQCQEDSTAVSPSGL